MPKTNSRQLIMKACTSLASATLCATIFLTTNDENVSANSMPLPVQNNVEQNINNKQIGAMTGTHYIKVDSYNPLLRHTESPTEDWGYLPPNLPTGKWDNISYHYDQSTKTLTINGGTAYSPAPIFKQIGTDIKQINITGNLQISGSMCAFLSSLPDLNTISGINNIDTSNVSDFAYTFAWNSSITSLDLTGWNTSKANNLGNIFDGDKKLVTVKMGNWDLHNAITMGCMFQGCSELSNVDVSKWDISNATDIGFMFNGCNKLTNLDVSNWNTAKVTKTSAMFSNCNSLNNLDVSKWNTSNVTDMSWMFNGCNELDTIDVSKWDTAKVTNMTYMFNQCHLLDKLNVSNWKTGNVIDMQCMFQGCEKLDNLDTSNWNTGNVTDMSFMFNGCNTLSKLDVANWKTDKVTNMSTMFQNCHQLAKLDVSEWNTDKVTDISWMFNQCHILETVDVSNWNTSNMTNMKATFQGCDKIDNINVSNWDTGKVTDTSNMFNNCKSLRNLDISNWKTSNDTNMSTMFQNCQQLNKLDVSNWNTAKVTDMRWLFYGCKNLTELDLSGFNDQNVSTDMHKNMLYGLDSLKKLILGKNINLTGANLNTPVEWVSVKNGTVQKPAGTEFYNSDNLSKFWNNKNYTETWVPGIQTKVIINYIDLDDNNKVIQSDSILGAAGHENIYKPTFDKIIADLKDKHYDYIASEDKLPWYGGLIKLPTNVGDSITYTVGFKHATTDVSDGDKNPVTGDAITGLNKTIKQTIKYSGTPSSIADDVQIIKFTKKGKVDLVTGKVTLQDWNEKEQTFKDVDSPKIAGYVPNIATVKGTTVKATDSDILKVVTYTRGSYNITINYVDGDDNNKVIKTDKVAGNPDKTISYHDQMQNIVNSLNGYEVDKDKSNLPLDENGNIKLPDSVTGDKDYQVVLKHKLTTIKPNDKNPVTNKVDDNLIKEIKQTIKYSGAGKDISDNVQTIKFTRNGKVDLVTGKVEYLDWNESEQSFKDVDSPDVTGYIASPKTVKGTSVKPTDNDVLKEVKYTRGDYNITINYVDSDDNDKVIKTDKVAGNPDKTIPYHDQMQNIVNSLNGYEVDKDKSNLPLDENGNIKLPDSVTGDKDYQVALKHKVVTIKPDDKNPVTGKEDDSLTKNITQTIKYTGAPSPIADNVQKVTFKRDADVDMVTGKLTYHDWDNKEQSFKDTDSPKIVGYDSDIATVKGATVKPTDSDIIKEVKYSRGNYNITINYVDSDDNDKVIKTDKVSGNPDKTISYHDQMKDIINSLNGYEVDKDKSNLPLDKNSDIKLPDNITGGKDYQVALKHKIATIKPDDKNPVTGKEDDSLTKTIKQTIKYRGADKDIPDNVQTVKFTRNGKVDLVTGKVVYLDWNEKEQTFKDVASPSVAGYGADPTTVKGAIVKPTDSDITKIVTYYKENNDMPEYDITINYQDENGKIIKTDKQKGKANSTISYKDRMKEIMTGLTKEGYEIDQDKSNLPLDENSDIKLGAISDNTTYKLVLKHKVVTFKHGEKNPFTGKEDPNQENTVTQTIKYLNSGKEKIPNNVQTLTFTRSAQVDMVTGKVTYFKWNEKKQAFKNVKSPFVKGYAADLPVVKGRAVTGDSKDIVQLVSYHKSNIVQTGLDIAKNGLPTILGLIAATFAGILSYFGIIKKKK